MDAIVDYNISFVVTIMFSEIILMLTCDWILEIQITIGMHIILL